MEEKKSKYIGYLVCGIILIVEFIIVISISFIKDETLKIENKQETLGEIIDIKNIYQSYVRGDFRVSFWGTIIVEYEVDGVKYCTSKRLKTYEKFNLSNYSIGNEVKVVYNKEIPSISAVDIVETYEIVIYIVLTIEMLVLIILLYRRVTKKKKLCLKVIAIEDVDYQTERVFFKEKNSKKLFFLEYDFGEEVKIGSRYELSNTHKNNYKKQIVLFENKNVEAYSIVDIDKDMLFKNEII